MRILADESVVFPIVRALREAGHDVAAIAELASGSPDQSVLARGVQESRVVLTEDRDFGELVKRDGEPCPGVFFAKGFPEAAHSQKCASVVEAVDRFGGSLGTKFAVVEPGRVRIDGETWALT